MPDEDLEVTELTDEETEFETAFAEHADAKEVEPIEAVDEDEEGEEAPIVNEDPAPVVDPYEGMDEAIKARFVALEADNAKLAHTNSSNAGRIRAYQKKAESPKPVVAQPSKTQIADAMKGSSEEWDQFKEDYPAVAQAIDNRFDQVGVASQEAINNTLAPVNEVAARIEKNEEETAAKEKVNTVAKSYPGWTEAVRKPEFNVWLNEQPPGIIALSESDDTDDASTLIGMYDNHLVSVGQPSMKPDPKPGVNEEAVPAGAELTDLEKRRGRQLESGNRSVSSKPAGIAADTESMDGFEKSFNVFASKKEQQRRQA